MAQARCYSFFATALGECAIAWNDAGITNVWLPEAKPEDLRRELLRRWQGAAETVPAADLVKSIQAMARLLDGVHVDLSGVALDWDGIKDFDRRVYAVTRRIAAGSVLTYGEVAARVGSDASARAVGQSLARNPLPIVVPCHRVVATAGALGGFSAPGGTSTKRRLLAIEDARRAGPPGLFDAPAP